MFRPVTLPLWLFVLIVLFAAVTLASHFLFPSVRWFFRKRMERAVARLNTRLKRPIAPFKLARRHDMIERLIYDPGVTEAIVDHSRRNGVPEAVAFQLARRYAREIVPAFSATVYFSIGARVARWLAQSFYRVRVGSGADPLAAVPDDAAVVFVMNHRSNMDYVLVTHLVSGQSDLSYAVGEWARVWPLSWLIRAMGAYFIQRGARGPLYRRVLERYVQMATAGGVTQAVFPEGGLSLNGRMAPPRMGILSYIVEGWTPAGRDVVFIPVALNYDRVIEDRFLVTAGLTGERRFRPPVTYLLGAALRHLGQRLTGRFRRLGTATVAYGTPLRLSEVLSDADGPPTEVLATRVMAGIAAVVPVSAVPLVARLVLTEGPLTRDRLVARFAETCAELAPRGIPVPRRTAEDSVDEALALLSGRGLVTIGDEVTAAPGDLPLLDYYAASIAHHFEGSGFPFLSAPPPAP